MGQVKEIRYANGTTSTYGQNSRLWPESFRSTRRGGASVINSSYSYDGAGNITRQALGAWSLSYSYSSNQLSRVSGAHSASYDYDAYGNVTKAGEATYRYDGAPHLRCIDCTRPNAVPTEYGYDGLGHRVTVLKAGAKSYEMYSQDGRLLIEYTPSKNNKLVEYIYLGRSRIAQRVTP